MKKIFINLTILMAILTTNLFATNLFAKAARIAVVDLQMILQSAPQVKKIHQELESKYKGRQEQIINLQNTINAKSQQLNKDAAILSNKAKQDLENEIATQRSNLEIMGQSYQQDVMQEQQESMRVFFTQLEDVINGIAKDNYDIVLQKDNIIFMAKEFDITSKLLDKLN